MKDRNGVALVLVLGGVLLAVLAIGQEKHLNWEMKRASDPGKVWWKIEVSKPGSHTSHSTDVPLDRFRGLPPDTFRSGSVNFEYVQDAGRLLCKGRFSWSKGSGTFTFVPNPQFSAELNRLGYETPDSEQIFHMMMSDIGLEYARGVKEAGLRATTSRLIDLKNHGVKLEYIQAIRKLGYEDLSAQDYIDMRNHGVKVEFVRDLKDAGYDLRPRQIIDLRNHGINTDYISGMKSLGLQPSAQELIRFRNHGVSPEYLFGLKEAGLDNLTADRVVDLKNHGVPTEFIRTAKELGYSFTPQELTDMRNHGVDGAYLRRLRDSGMKNLSASQITKLRQHGVN